MKTRTLILLIASAVVTLSISLGATFNGSSEKEPVVLINPTVVSGPIGGLAANDLP